MEAENQITTSDPLGQQFLERQAQIKREDEEAPKIRDDPKSGWTPNVFRNADNVPQQVFNANEFRTPNQNVPRLQKPALPTTGDIKDQIDTLISDLKESSADFQNVSLDAWYAPLKDQEITVAALREQLAAEEAKLRELEDRGTPSQVFRSLVESSESQVSQVATQLLVVLANLDAHEKFGVSYDRLPDDTKKALRIRHEDKLRRFGPFFVSMHRRRDVTSQQLVQRVTELATALNDIVKGNL